MLESKLQLLSFTPSPPLTVGVELELQIVDPLHFRLRSVSQEILKSIGKQPWIQPELLQGMLEVNSLPRENIHRTDEDLREAMVKAAKAATEFGAAIACAGTHPHGKYWEQKPLDLPRFSELIDRNQYVARRLLIFGMHVHIGVESGDLCIALMNELIHELPIFLALSASSPFWEGLDTGLASARSTVFETIPTGGHPCQIADWREFDELTQKLVRAKAIRHVKDIWWDIRPSPGYGTVEVRVCDALPTLTENSALAALIHATAAECYERLLNDHARPRVPDWMIRENKWRAARHGLETNFVTDTDGGVKPFDQAFTELKRRIGEYVEDYGYQERLEALDRLVEYGGAYSRQRTIFHETGRLDSVSRYLTRVLAQDLGTDFVPPVRMEAR